MDTGLSKLVSIFWSLLVTSEETSILFLRHNGNGNDYHQEIEIEMVDEEDNDDGDDDDDDDDDDDVCRNQNVGNSLLFLWVTSASYKE